MIAGDSRRRRLVIGAALAAGALLVALVAWTAIRSVQPDIAGAVDQDVAGPVVLVPGYGGGTAALDLLASQLRTAGRSVTVVSSVGDGTGDLREQASVLGEVVDELLASSEAASVDVIGYSAGGVVVRWWAQEDGGAAQARRIVTLGSPHHGTSAASLANAVFGAGCPEACQQLRPDSDLLTRLNSTDETPSGPQWTAIWSESDDVVTPPSSGSLEGATDVSLQEVCPGVVVEHGDLPRDPVVTALVLEAFGSGDPPATDGSDCARLQAAGAALDP